MVGEALKPVLFVVAAIYIAIDELFALITQPIAAWLARQNLARRLRRWITSLPPYPALALFAIPLIVLEPVKPVAAYLAATGHFAIGAALFVGGELLKLVLIERLFLLNKHKLLSIPAFARCYAHIRELREWIEATAAFRSMRRLVHRVGSFVRDLAGRWTADDADEPRALTTHGRSAETSRDATSGKRARAA